MILDSRTIGIVLVCVVLGSIAGYAGGVLVFQPQMAGLSQRLTQAEAAVAALQSNYGVLSLQYANLSQEHDSLEQLYSALAAEQSSLSHALPSFVIYRDGGLYMARSGVAGVVTSSGSDAATVIQSAIDLLTNGGRILLLAGSYSLTSQLTQRASIWLDGEYPATILELEADVTLIATPDDEVVSETRLSNLILDGNGRPQRLVDWKQVTYGKIDHCIFRDSAATFVKIGGNGTSHYNKITDNKFVSALSSSNESQLDVGQDNFIIDNCFTKAGEFDSAYAVTLNGASSIFLGNTVNAGTGSGGGVHSLAGNAFIVSNHFDSIVGTGLKCGNSSYQKIIGNVFYQCSYGSSDYPAMEVNSGADHFIISDNAWTFGTPRYCIKFNTNNTAMILANNILGDYSVVAVDWGKGFTGKVANNIGVTNEASGTSTGTGSRQAIPHGLYTTPSIVLLSDRDQGADPYQSATADSTYIYVTATYGKAYTWRASV